MNEVKVSDPLDKAEVIQTVKRLLEGRELQGFMVGIHYGPSYSDEQRETLKKGFQKELAEELEGVLGCAADYVDGDIQIYLDLERCTVSLHVKSVYIQGRYNKYERGLAQTIFYCHACKGRGCPSCGFSGRKGRTSIEELLTEPMKRASGASRVILHGLGREDVDVRMLGSGRPFVLELAEPLKRTFDLPALEHEINSLHKGRIEVTGLRFADRDAVKEVKSAVVDKVYEARVVCDAGTGTANPTLPSAASLEWLVGTTFVIRQLTPRRVLPRRTDKVRMKRGTVLELERSSATELRLKLRADSGLYVKEFISSDLGRTRPSLASLLGSACSCVELDVLEILR